MHRLRQGKTNLALLRWTEHSQHINFVEPFFRLYWTRSLANIFILRLQVLPLPDISEFGRVQRKPCLYLRNIRDANFIKSSKTFTFKRSPRRKCNRQVEASNHDQNRLNHVTNPTLLNADALCHPEKLSRFLQHNKNQRLAAPLAERNLYISHLNNNYSNWNTSLAPQRTPGNFKLSFHSFNTTFQNHPSYCSTFVYIDLCRTE